MQTQILKQVVGIDVSQDELVVSLGQLTQDLSTQVVAQKSFVNKAAGFSSLQEWVSKHTDGQLPVLWVMEATGVYHEALAYFLSDQQCSVSIVVPTKISNYMRTLDLKTITDKTSAEAIMLFGLQRQLTRWSRPSATFKQLRQLTRERDQVIDLRTMSKNHLHAERAESRTESGNGRSH